MNKANNNENPFFKWAIEKYSGKDSPRGDFTDDMKRDYTFPATADRERILAHLYAQGACDEAIAVFKRMWRDYKKALPAPPAEAE